MTAVSLLGAIFGTLHCREFFQCNTDIDSYGGIVLWFMLCFYMFKQLGTICDEHFVPSLEVIVEKLEMSNDVAGATFMAAGSSAPELFTSLVATFFIVNEGGVGTIIGSAIFNILVIVGATGWCACKEKPLKIWWYPLTRDSIFYVISITELMIVLSDDVIHWYESVCMVITYFFYIFYMWLNPKVIAYFGLELEEEEEEADDCGGECEKESSQDTMDPPDDIREPSKESKDSVTFIDETGREPPTCSWHDPVHEVAAQNGCTAPGAQAEMIEVKGAPKTCTIGIVDLPCAVPGQIASDGDGAERKVSKSSSSVASKEKRKMRSRTEPSLGSDSSVDGGNEEEDGGTGAEKFQKARLSCSTHSLMKPSSKGHPKVRMSLHHLAAESQPELKPLPGDITKNVLPVVPSQSGDSLCSDKGEDTEVCEDTDVQSVERRASSKGSQPSIKVVSTWLRDPLAVAMERFMPPPERHWTLFALSISCIGVATYVMVDAVNRAGTIMKVPPMVMGLTVLAAGTSIPDAMGSIAVAKQGEGDMAVANALGSNIFDILVGLGVPWTIRIAMGGEVRFDGKFKTMGPDIVILAAVLFLFLGCLLLNRWRLTRSVGVVLILVYFANVVYNILAVYLFKTKLGDDD